MTPEMAEAFERACNECRSPMTCDRDLVCTRLFAAGAEHAQDELDYFSERIFLTYTDLKNMFKPIGIQPKHDNMFEAIRQMVRDFLNIPSEFWERRIPRGEISSLPDGCKAHLNLGEQHLTMYCEIGKGHAGRHMQHFGYGLGHEHQGTITWEHDDRDA